MEAETFKVMELFKDKIFRYVTNSDCQNSSSCGLCYLGLHTSLFISDLLKIRARS